MNITIIAAADDLVNLARETGRQFGFDLWIFLSQIISFVLVALLLKRFAYKPILRVLEERRQRIAEGLLNAEKIKQQLAEAEMRHQEILAQANEKAQKMIDEARASAGVLAAYRLDPLIEDAVRDAIHRTSNAGGSVLALEPSLARDIVAAVGRALGEHSAAASPVLLTSADIRRYVRRLLETDHPELAVLAYPELAPEARVQDLGAIRP